MSQPPTKTGQLSSKSLEHARAFLSALFMGLRTAQIHDPSNRAFAKAVDTVHRAADALYASTNGFQIQFVEESAFLNGTRLRFEGGAYTAMRSLRHLLESHQMGGVAMNTPPSPQAIKTLILLFSQSAERVSAEDVQRAQVGILGVQRFSDGDQDFRVDRRVFAVQSYAKLILALREQFERAETAMAYSFTTTTRAPRMRAVRVIQDLVELCGDRADFILRLALNDKGVEKDALYGANCCLLSIAMGHALGLDRQDLVDLGVGALFHPVGFRLVGDQSQIEMMHLQASLARILQESGVNRSSQVRAIVVAECLIDPDENTQVHPFSRIVRVAANFACRLVGFPLGEPMGAMPALESVRQDKSGFLDARMVDLLVNVLRAYPEGTPVWLDSGQEAEVLTQVGGSRWDRPITRTSEGRNLDLMIREGGRFVDRIVATSVFVGKAAAEEMIEELPADATGDLIAAAAEAQEEDEDLDLSLPDEDPGPEQPASPVWPSDTQREEAPIPLLDFTLTDEELDAVPVGDAFDLGDAPATSEDVLDFPTQQDEPSND